MFVVLRGPSCLLWNFQVSEIQILDTHAKMKNFERVRTIHLSTSVLHLFFIRHPGTPDGHCDCTANPSEVKVSRRSAMANTKATQEEDIARFFAKNREKLQMHHSTSSTQCKIEKSISFDQEYLFPISIVCSTSYLVQSHSSTLSKNILCAHG